MLQNFLFVCLGCFGFFFVTIHVWAVIAEDIIRSTSTLPLQSSVIYIHTNQQIEVNPPIVLGINEHRFLDPCQINLYWWDVKKGQSLNGAVILSIIGVSTSHGYV